VFDDCEDPRAAHLRHLTGDEDAGSAVGLTQSMGPRSIGQPERLGGFDDLVERVAVTCMGCAAGASACGPHWPPGHGALVAAIEALTPCS
jgi:hypothetical protein